MCVYIYICIYMYIYMHTHTHAHTYIHTHTHTLAHLLHRLSKLYTYLLQTYYYSEVLTSIQLTKSLQSFITHFGAISEVRCPLLTLKDLV